MSEQHHHHHELDDELRTTTTAAAASTSNASSEKNLSDHDISNTSISIGDDVGVNDNHPDTSTITTNVPYTPNVSFLVDDQPQPQQPQGQRNDGHDENANLLATILDELENERARRIQAEMNLSKQLLEIQQQSTKDHPPPIQQQPPQQQPPPQQKQQQQQEDDLLYDSHTSLIVAHEINSMFFAESSTISKKQLSLWKLSTFFQKVSQNLEPCHGNANQPPPVELPVEFKKTREKLIKDAIKMVYKDLEDESTSTPLASRLMRRVDYDEGTLKPVLQKASRWLIGELMVVWKEDRAFRQRYDTWMENIKQERRNYRRRVKTLTTERNEYRSLLDKLLSDNDAVMLASKNVSGCLPMHQVLFLEIMPWDDRVKDYISSRDQVYQWQVWDDWTGKWSDKKVKNVGFFQKLPINKMQRNDIQTNKSVVVGENNVFDLVENHRKSSPVRKIQHAFDSLGLKGRFLTDANCSCVLDLSEGYPLPGSGTWEWVGNWSLTSMDGGKSSNLQHDGNNTKTDPKHSHDDEKDVVGWVYADNVDVLCCNNDDGRNGGKFSISLQSTSKFRRRTWTRERVLVSYPGISPATKQMLEMNAHNTRLTLAMSKLHEQVHDMQMKLFQKEEELEVMQEEMIMGNKTSKNSVEQQSVSPKVQEAKNVHNHPLFSDAKTTLQSSNKINLGEEKENSFTIPASPLITLDDMRERNGNGFDADADAGTNTVVDADADADAERVMDTNTPSTDETSKEIDTPLVDHDQAGTIIARQPSDNLAVATARRLDSYSSWIMNSDLILESMKHNVQSAKHSVQTISKKAQHIIVNSKPTR